MIGLIWARLATHSAAALSFVAVSPVITHDFTPEVVFTFPGNPPGEYRVAAQATDTVRFDTAGITFSPSAGTTPLEFLLSAPQGYRFLINPGSFIYQLGFSLEISDAIAAPSAGTVTAQFIDASVELPLTLLGWTPEQTGNVTHLFGLSSDAPSSSFTFSGLLIRTDLFTSGPSGPFSLDSASFDLFTRNLAINSDPGPALSLIPELSSYTVVLLAAGLFVIPRRRS